MVNLSERQVLIVRLIGEHDRPVTAAELATLLGVSARTLRYDIARINRQANGAVVVSTPTGYRVGARGQEAVLDRAVRGVDDDDRDVLVYLLTHDETDVYDIARDCYLGETRVRSVLRSLVPDLAAQGLTLRVIGSRVVLDGPEFGRRRVLGRLARTALARGTDGIATLRPLLPDVELERVEQAVATALGAAGLRRDHLHLQNLVVNIAICLQRSARATGDDPGPGLLAPPVPGSVAEHIAADLLDRLSWIQGTRRLRDGDLRYVAALVRLALEDGEPSGGADDAGRREVDEVVTGALDRTIAHYGIEVERDPLRDALVDHVGRLRVRTASLVFFQNTLRENLRSRSPFLYDVAVYLARQVSEALGITVDDEEIGLLAVYLGLHVLPGTRDDEVTATLVCPDYRVLRERMLATLGTHYADRIRVTDIVGTLTEAEGTACDLVLSAVGAGTLPHPVVTVSAMLSPLDRAAIDLALARVAEARFRRRISAVLARFLDPRLFFTGLRFADAASTIAFLAGELERVGAVGPDFMTSVLERESFSPTAFAHRFAVPHAMEFAADVTRIAVLLPASAVDWGNGGVSAVLMLAINEDDYSDFSLLYQSLVELLYDPETFRALLAISDFDELMSFLEQRLGRVA